MRYDALVVGGSFAGLSAAMQLARARRKVCVVDAGAPRNRFAAASHGFFGQDGMPPLKMIADARDKLLAYPSVEFIEASVSAVKADGGDGFTVSLGNGEQLSASKLLLAFGVQDGLPDIAGIGERWGKSVLHCPYCHGYEFGDRPLGVLFHSGHPPDHAMLIAEWGPTTLFLNGAEGPDAEARARLQARGVAVEPGRIAGLEGQGTDLAGVRIDDGRLVPIEALFVAPHTRPASPLGEQLGCAFDDGPSGKLLRVDAMKMTTVPGVYAAGDLAMAFSNATLASADGLMAGVSMHRSLVFGV
ncbi:MULTISPECIES: NAD(P)/FAD-dependent oxidoreductase [unclassified Variovorax]|uniref:NAD(P)/FAD-dependent oxidoreductase n=1 Tax=unclassified Variovorax TaxID=663243 RepID=UPI0008B4D390|nr:MULTISPECIES: NAD(P)/FAD-dependent oxidoreductase [unclassified Variovorax]SEK16056.1 Thioredoxin reductase [Variovorax sp. OK202]SFE30750.1 Thioredoxin reductase [Variovorax sp. OK212]